MVDFIREQTRQYASDQSGAIRQDQMANNIKEWNSVIQDAGRIAKSVMANREKTALEADEQMINTEAVSRLENDLLQWNTDNVAKGVDTSTEEYTKQLYAKRDELFVPYIEQMQSKKGRSLLQEQGNKSAERIRKSNIGTIAQNRKKAQARQAFVDTVKNVQNDAREFGKLGDWQGFKEATDSDRTALKKYAKANNIPEYQVDMSNIQNFVLGQAESDPEEVIKIFGTEADYKEIKRAEQKEKMKNPDAPKADEFADDVTDWQYRKEDIENYSRRKKLEMLPEEAVKQVRDDFVFGKKQEKLELEKQINASPKGSARRVSLEKKRDEIQGQIDDPEKYVVDMLTDNISKAVVPIAKKQLGMNRLQAKQLEKEAEISTYRAVLNPDTSVSNEAMMALALGRKQTEEMLQMSLPDDDMQKAYDAYAQANTEVLQREYATFDGTEAMFDAYKKVLQHDPADQLGAIKEVFDGYVALHNAPVTQEQADNYKALMHAAITDNAFADLVKGYVSIKDRYYPDTSWFENSIGRADNPALRTVGASPLILDPSNIDFYSRSREEQETLENYDQSVYNMPEGVRLDEQGLVTTAIMAQDKDTIEKYLKNKTIEIVNNTGGMLALAAAEKDPDVRNVLGQKALDYFNTEKRKAFDYAMENFGVDMAKLREVYNTRGEAITQLGMKRVKYVGDDPSTGLPNWEPYEDEKATNEARDRILLASKMI